MFVIRDDDLSAWTDVNDIRALYGTFLNRGGKVCFAVVPNSVQAHNRGDRSQMYQSFSRKKISENIAIIDFLEPYIRNGQVEIMQHGYDHGYFIDDGTSRVFLDEANRKKIGKTRKIRFIPECCAKEKKQLKHELKEGKKILEDAFGVDINVFVPPSNSLTSDAADVINDIGMNISGTVTNRLNRKVDVYLFSAVAKKILWRTIHQSITYPKMIRYNNHLELTAHAFTPTTDNDNFNEQLMFCLKRNYPFVLATHYWELLSNNDLKELFYRVIFEQLNKKNIGTITEEFNKYDK